MTSLKINPLSSLLAGLCLVGTACASDSDSDNAAETETTGASTGGPAGTETTPLTTTTAPGTTSGETSTGVTTGDTDEETTAADGSTTGGGGGDGLDPSHFDPNGLNEDIEIVDCTLSNGDEASCYQIVIGGSPADHDSGPYCPRNISDGAEDAGIWIESGEVYDVDGTFIQGLAEFYDDPTWQLFDPKSGDVFVTDTLAACQAAAVPQVPEEYNNYCVECSLDDFGGGVEQTVLIPVTPVSRDAPLEVGAAAHVGLALNGVVMDPPAPVANILAGYTIAAFDDCGGHVNPFEGYHYHAATGCPGEVAADDGYAPLIGYALDGYAIYAMQDADGNEADDLDECRGREDDVRGYHYRVASPGENMFIGCFHGEVVGMDDGPGGGVASCDDVPEGMPCCGDDMCGGPENNANCPEDCD